MCVELLAYFKGDQQRIQHVKAEFIPHAIMPLFRNFLERAHWVARYELQNDGMTDLLIMQIINIQTLYNKLTKSNAFLGSPTVKIIPS